MTRVADFLVTACFDHVAYPARSAHDDPNGEDEEEEDSSDDEDAIQRPRYDFSKLSPRIQQVIDDYGAVFPKLNWSSPQVCSTITDLCLAGQADLTPVHYRTQPSCVLALH